MSAALATRPTLASGSGRTGRTSETGGADANLPTLTGAQRAAVVLLAVGDDVGGEIIKHLNPDEIRQISSAMAEMGSVPARAMSDVVASFLEELGTASAAMGGFDQVERLLRKSMPDELVNSIMQELSSKAKSDIWRKLPNIDAALVSHFLRGEHPQTVALILSRCGAPFAARMLKSFEGAVASDIVSRMLQIQPIDTTALHDLEDALRLEFLATGAKKPRRDTHAEMAEIFNYLDDRTQTFLMGELERGDENSAQRVRNLMFTFNDLLSIDRSGIQTILQIVDKDVLARALASADPALATLFLENMSARAAKRMADDMANLPKLTRAETDAARTEVLNVTKKLMDKGDVRRPTSEEVEEE